MNVIKPSDISKNRPIPQFILDVVNTHLKENYSAGKLVVKVQDITSKITVDFDYKDLNFEYVYNDAGWICKFVKTPYYEPFDYWTFEAK